MNIQSNINQLLAMAAVGAKFVQGEKNKIESKSSLKSKHFKKTESQALQNRSAEGISNVTEQSTAFSLAHRAALERQANEELERERVFKSREDLKNKMTIFEGDV